MPQSTYLKGFADFMSAYLKKYFEIKQRNFKKMLIFDLWCDTISSVK